MASTAHLRGTDDVIKDTSVAAAGAAVCQSTLADLIRHSPMKGKAEHHPISQQPHRQRARSSAQRVLNLIRTENCYGTQPRKFDLCNAWALRLLFACSWLGVFTCGST